MSNQHGNEQEFVHFIDENGTNVENDKQKQKMKPLAAFVQIVFNGPNNPIKVELSQKCSIVAEHAAFLLEKINESQGNLIGLELNGPVALAAVLKDDVFMMDHDVPLEVDCKYTFKFKQTKVQEQEDGSNPVEELAKQVEQLEKWKEEQEKKWEEHQKPLEEEEAKAKMEEEQRIASAEYASLIGVPIVANLQPHYDRQKLLQLLEHGTTIPSIYIQSNQRLNDSGIVRNIVDLLATAEKPEKMVGEVTIEHGGAVFDWPQRKELKLKEKKRNVAITSNEASPSASPHTSSNDCCLAEYELTNRGCRFQVLIHYYERYFNKFVWKFTYRRMP